MNPRMTLGLDFKSPSLVAVKKEKRDPDNNHHPVPQPAAVAVVKREIKEEEEDLALAFNVDNYYSQQSHYHHHQEDRDEDLFVPPTQQPSDSAAYRVPLTLQHHRPQPTAGSITMREQTETRPSVTRDESWAVPERSRRGEENECDVDEYGDERRKERKRSRERSEEEGEGEEEDDEPLHRSRREGRKAKERKEEREVVAEEYDDEESTRTNYEVVVGCTPDVRQGGGTTVPGMPPYFWQAGATATTTTTTTTTIKTEESRSRDDDNGSDNEDERRENVKQQQEDVDVEEEKDEKEEKEDEEESEGSGHSAIIQQLLQKNKASSTGQVRVSFLMKRCVLFERRLTPIGWRVGTDAYFAAASHAAENFVLHAGDHQSNGRTKRHHAGQGVQRTCCPLPPLVCVCGGGWLICYFSVASVRSANFLRRCSSHR